MQFRTFKTAALLGLALAVVSMAPALGAGPGPRPGLYQLIPEGADSGAVWTNNGLAKINWWTWFDDTSAKWYYSYQFGNTGLQPHLGSVRFYSIPGNPQVEFTGDGYNLGTVPPIAYWNELVWNNLNFYYGWAADQGQELVSQPIAQGTSPEPNLMQFRSPFSPGPMNVKVADLNYQELLSNPYQDPFDWAVVPGPMVPEPASIVSLAVALGLAGTRRRKKT